MATATYTAGVRSQSLHLRGFPMWVVRVSEALRMQAPLAPHEELLISGRVVLHESSFYTTFISHQWLGRHHPDPDGRQFQVLQRALHGRVSGGLLKESDTARQFLDGNRKMSRHERRAFREGYIWLDWFSIPQSPTSPAQQAQAILSIPSYIESCNTFLALVPRLQHESGNPCDYESWLRRGWCLAELWCAQLSNRQSLPMVAVHGSDNVTFAETQHWIYAPAHEGDFTIEADRAFIKDMMKASLQARITWLEAKKTQLGLCRYLKGRCHDWAALADGHTQRSEGEFLAYFGFPSMAKALKVKNIGALACAVLSDNIPMIRRLVEARAALARRCETMMNVDVLTWTPLHLAVQRGSRALPVIVELSIEGRSQHNRCYWPSSAGRQPTSCHR